MQKRSLQRLQRGTISDGGAYQAYGRQFARDLAREGIRVELIESDDSIDNIRKLESPNGADVEFVQGGPADFADPAAVMAIGALYLEPIWLFTNHGMYALSTPMFGEPNLGPPTVPWPVNRD